MLVSDSNFGIFGLTDARGAWPEVLSIVSNSEEDLSAQMGNSLR